MKTKWIFLCDPLTMAIAMIPETITSYYLKFVQVELKGTLSYGAIAIDWTNSAGMTANTYIPVTIDKAKVY